jgi:flagellar biosynthesis protein FliP
LPCSELPQKLNASGFSPPGGSILQEKALLTCEVRNTIILMKINVTIGVETLMKSKVLLGLCVASVYMISLPIIHAENTSPYGDYKKGATESGYGEKRPVSTFEEAKKVLTEYFAKKNVYIGVISEQELFFEAEIRDKNNTLVDKVIVDKRTGRIRSTY